MLILRPAARFRASVICLALAASGLPATQAVAVEPIPDYKTLVFPSIISKAGSTNPPANSDPGTIRNNYENYYENFWKDISYFSYDPATGQKEQGFYIDTKTYGYIHMPWPINQVSNLPVDTFTGNGRVIGGGEPFQDGNRRYSQNLANLGLLGAPDAADADGFWTPGESFQDSNGNSQYDPYRPAEDYWNNDNTQLSLQQRNAAGAATGNLSASLSGGVYRGPAPDNNVDNVAPNGANDWNANWGELFADYNEDTDLTNDSIGYDAAGTIFLAGVGVQNAVVINELDLSPENNASINEGDFAHTIVADAAHVVGPVPANIPRNGVFDFTTTTGDIPQVRRVTYRNGNLLWVQYSSYVQTNAATEAVTPVVYRYAQVYKQAGAPPTGYAVRTVRAPVYQSGELYGRVKGSNISPPAIEYGDNPAGNNNANLYPNTRQVLADNTWTPARAAELWEDYLVFGGPNTRYRNDIDPGPPGGNALDPQRPGRGTTNGPRNSITQAEYEAYIQWNYPELGATNALGVVTGIVDAISYVGGVITNAPNGIADNIDALIARADNGQYDGPEVWTERQTTKVTFNVDNTKATLPPVANWIGGLFGFPTWEIWWQAAFNSPAPAWNAIVAPSVNIYAPNSGARADGWIPADSWSYDSDREFCDLPSSVYHIGGSTTAVTAASYSPLLGFLRQDLAAAGAPMGDQWIGEITSPWSQSLSGQDIGPGLGLDFVGPGEADGFIIAGGPFCFNSHGNNGHDAGNVLGFELMTWRTAGDRVADPLYPGNLRDVNLDAFLDTGNGRVGDVNYASRPNGDGSGGYPFNRMRYMEDLIEIWDSAQDFNTFPLFNPVTGLPFLYGYGIYEQTENVGSGGLGGPAGATTTFFTRDRVDPIDILFQIRPIEGGELDGEIPTGTGVVVSNQVNGANFGMGILCHEQGHDLLGYPDLYDYDVWNGQQATINRPIGSYDLMSGGGLVHGIPDFKIGFGAGWATPVNLNSLVPLNGGPTVVELYPAEDYGQNSYFFYPNPSNNFEYMYFYYYGSNSPYAPSAGGPGVYITHTDLDSNPNGVPNQQRINNHFTWEVIQADGFYHLADGVNAGDAGDPFPGATRKFIFTEDTTPAARWWDQQEAGIRILDIALPTVLGEPALVTFERFNNAVASPIVPTAGNDLDNDGLPDAWEVHYWGNTTTSNGTGDYDFDDLTDLGEYLAGTSPIDSDTDNDNVPDGQEDADADGIANQDEINVTGTHPGLVDSDDDGWLDGNELNATVLSGDRFLTSPAHSVSPLIERCLFFNGTAIPVPPSVLPSQPDRFDNQAAAWTLEAWVNPAGSETGSIIRRRTATGFVSFELRLDGNIPSVRFSTLANGIVQAGGTVAIPSGEWTHLAGVWNNANDTLSLYVNGVSYRAQTSLFSPAQGRGSVVLGDGITGSVDEVRIWQTARTAAQIEAFSHSIVGSPLQTATNQLIAYYRFDDGGDLAEDFMHPITVGAANVNNFRYALDNVTFDNTDCVKFCQIDDFNANGMADWYENLFFGYSPPTLPGPSGAADADSDGLTNLFEYHADSNPKDNDSDNDGIVDSSEDRDVDGLSNALEQGLGSSPVLRDTDDDGIDDNQESSQFQSPVSSTSPLQDRVLSLNGSPSAFAELARNSDSMLSATNWTVEAWVNPSALGADGEIIVRQVEAGKYQYRLRLLASGQLSISYTPDNGGADEVLTSTQTLAASAWRHVSATYSKPLTGTGVLRILVDGTQWANKSVSTTPVRNGVGPISARIGSGFNGQLDEVRFWNLVPASRTLEQLRLRSAGTETGLALYFRFDDGTNLGGTSGNATWTTGQVEDYTFASDWQVCWSHAATLRGAAVLLNAGAGSNGGDAVDTDLDGLPNTWEAQYGLNPNVNLGTDGADGDSDGDGLSNLTEYQAGTNPRLADSNNNGVADGLEDADGDGLSTVAEQNIHQTHPGLPDTDDDGLGDKIEVDQHTAPADSTSPYVMRQVCNNGLGEITVPGQIPGDASVSDARFNLSVFTLEVNVRLTRLPSVVGQPAILIQRKVGANGLLNYELGIGTDDRPYVRFQTDLGTEYRTTANMPVPVGEWTHLAGKFGPDERSASFGQLSLYYNQTKVSRDTTNARPVTGSQAGDVILGRNLDGCIDEVRMWRVPRTDFEIQSLVGKSLLFGLDSANAGSLRPGVQGQMNATPPSLSAFTVAAWVKGDTDGTIYEIASGAASNGDPIYNVRLQIVNGQLVGSFDFLAPIQVQTLHLLGPPTLDCQCRYGTFSLTGSTNVSDGQWHFVAFTLGSLNGGSASLVVDDFIENSSGLLPPAASLVQWHEEILETATGNYCAIPQCPVSLANQANVVATLGFNYTGLIDEVAVYGAALPAGELINNRFTRPRTADTRLIQYYDFDGDAPGDDLVEDKSQSGADGLLIEPATVVVDLDSNAPINIRPVDILALKLAAYFPLDDGRWLGATGNRINGLQAVEDQVHPADFRFAGTLSSPANIDFSPSIPGASHPAPMSYPVFFPAPLDSIVRTDADGDGMPDVFEQYFALDPNRTSSSERPNQGPYEDMDGDGLFNLFEYYAGADPTTPDSDGDGISDADEDGDGDGLANRDEQSFGSNPGRIDSDDDGLTDTVEVTVGANGRAFASNPMDSMDYRNPYGLGGPDCQPRDKYMVLDGNAYPIPAPTAQRKRFNASSWTVECWVMPGAANSNGSLIQYVGRSYPVAGGAPVPHTFYELGLTNGVPYVKYDSTSGAVAPTVAMGPLLAGQWTHLAGVYDPTRQTLSLYVNGGLTAQRQIFGTALSGSQTAENFPGNAFIGAPGLRGGIDDVRIWNIARTPAQIVSGIEIGVQANTAGQIVNFRFDDGRARTSAGVDIPDGTGVAAGQGAEDFAHRSTSTDLEAGWPYSLRGITFACVPADCAKPMVVDDIDQDGLADGWENIHYNRVLSIFRPVFASTQIVASVETRTRLIGSDSASFSALNLGWSVDHTPLYTLPGRRLTSPPDTTYAIRDFSLDTLPSSLEMRLAIPAGSTVFLNGTPMPLIGLNANGTVFNPAVPVNSAAFYVPSTNLLQLVSQGRNRISIQLRNDGSALTYEYFNLELVANGSTYLIRRGDDPALASEAESRWLVISYPGSLATPPLDGRGRAWNNRDYAFDADEDSDGDGLVARTESFVRTNPLAVDTDGDGVRDNAEDFDADGLNNLTEASQGSDPRLVDTDDDGLTDASEVALFQNPASSLSPLVDRVLSVNGATNCYVEFAANSRTVLSATNWNVEAWVYARALGADGEIIARELQANKFQYRLRVLASGQVQVSYSPVGGGPDEVLTSTPTLVAGEWHHVSANFSKPLNQTGLLQILVDGVIVANKSISSTPLQYGIGPSQTRAGKGFNGELDEVRLWNTTQPGRSLAVLRAPILAVPASLAVYYRFDDGTNPSGVSGIGSWVLGHVEDAASPSDWLLCWSHAGSLRGAATLAIPSTPGGFANSSLDSDGDGLPDGWELQFGLNPNVGDNGVDGARDDIDGDGLSNLQEYLAGTNPRLIDTDNDGQLDGDEDSDGDTLSNLEEQNFHRTNPGLADTDDDGVTDDVELNGLVAKADGRHFTSPIASDSPAISRSLRLGAAPLAIPETGYSMDEQSGLNVLVSDRFAAVTNWTFEIWVKPDTAAETGSLLRRQTRGGLTSFEIRLDGNVPSVRFQTKAGVFHTVGGTVAIPAGEWTYLASTLDMASRSFTLYVNGVAYRGLNTFGVPATGVGSTTLGGGVNGLVDNLRIWDAPQTGAFLEENSTNFFVLSGGAPSTVPGLPGVNFTAQESWAKQVMGVDLGEQPEGNNFANEAAVLGQPDSDFLSLGHASQALVFPLPFGGQLTPINAFFGSFTSGMVFGTKNSTVLPDAGWVQVDMGDPNLLPSQNRLHANGDAREDLFIIERLSEPESVSVLLSVDGDSWYHVGDTAGGISGIDLDSAPFSRLLVRTENNVAQLYGYSLDPADFAPTNAPIRSADFRYVWLVANTQNRALDQLASLSVPGPDIDAIGIPYYENIEPMAWYSFDDGENPGSASGLRGAEDYAYPLSPAWNIRDGSGGLLSFSNDAAPIHGFKDADGNGLPDWWGNLFFGSATPFNARPTYSSNTNGFGQVIQIDGADEDRDGIINLYEYLGDTNPRDTDSDNDGILDRSEDPDADGLSNLREQERDSHPMLADSDDDGLLDGAEVAQLTSPSLSSSPLIGRALTLSGAAGQFLEMPYAIKYALTNFTVEAWVRVNALGASQTILSRQVAAGAHNYKLTVLPSGQIEFRFTREDRSGDEVLVSGASIVPGTWTHVAGITGRLAGSRRMRIQIDGVNVADRLTDALPASNGVGPVRTRAGEALAGQIDDLRINSVALDARALNSLRQVISGSTTNLVAYFRFDDATHPAGTSAKAAWTTGQVEDFTTTSNWLQYWHRAATLRGGAAVAPPIGQGGVNAEFTDLDQDDMADAWESNNGLDPTLDDGALDADGDGLSNFYEYQSGTNPNLVDSDLDGVNDGLEDSDGDGLTNLNEQILHFTDAGAPDTDDDGITDKQEVDQATNPNESLDPFVIRQICNDGSGELTVPGSNPNDPEVDGARFDLAEFTLEAMVKLDRLPSATGQNVLLMQRRVKPSGYVNWELGIDITDRPYVRFQDNSGSEYRVTGNAPVPVGVWTHVAGRFGPDPRVGNTQLALIYNHVSLSRDVTNTRPVTGEMLGDLPMARNLFGCIDEVRIWKVARSDQIIDNLVGKSLLFGFDSAGAASLSPNTNGRLSALPLNLATNFTVSAWVRGNGDGEIAYVQHGTAADGATLYNFRIRIVNGLPVATYDFNADLLFRVPAPIFRECRPRWGTVTLNSDVPVNDGKWHFVALIFNRGNAIDSGVAQLLVDNREVDAVRFLPLTNQVIWHYAAVDVVADHLGYCSEFFFNDDFNSMAVGSNLGLQVGVRYGGSIDEVAVYDVAHSATNTVLARTEKHNPADPDLLAYYDFDNVEANDLVVANKVNNLANGLLVSPARLSLGRGSNAPLSIRPVDILREILAGYYPMEDGRYLGATGPRTNGRQAVEDYVRENDMRFAGTLSSVNAIDFTPALVNQVNPQPLGYPVLFPTPFDSPYRIDSDGDGMPDVFEQYFNLDPNLDINVIVPHLGSLEDLDEDGLFNLYEYYAGTDPTNPDSDGDGITDLDEDGDRDGLTNGDEQAIGSNPGRLDSDDDGYSDLLETNPELVGRAFATNPADSADYQTPFNLTGADCRNRQKYMVLDGADHQLPTPPTDRRRFNANSWTVEGWVLLDAANASGSIFRYVGESYPTPGGAPVAHTFYELGVSAGMPYAKMQGTATFTVIPAPVQMGPIPAGTWVHLAAVFDDDRDFLGLYVNGTLAAQRQVVGGGLAGSTTANNFPGRAYAGSVGYTGALDDLRVWNYARSHAQIRNGMTTLVQASEPGQIANFRFDDGRARDAGGAEIPDSYTAAGGQGAEDYAHRPRYQDLEEGWQYSLRGITFGCSALNCPRGVGFDDRDQDGLIDGYEDLFFQADKLYYRPIFDSTDQIVDDTQLTQHVSGSDTASFSALSLGWSVDFTPIYTLPNRRLSRSPDKAFLFKDVTLPALTDRIEIRMANPVGGRLWINGTLVTNQVGAANGTFVYNVNPVITLTQTYYYPPAALTNLFTAGRNRIAVEVLNSNGTLPYEYFSLELIINGGTYLIRRGDDNDKTDNSQAMWFEYSRVGSTAEPPLDRRGRQWFARDYATDAQDDLDSDGMSSLRESIVRTNPKTSDTDADGIPDGLEDFDGDGVNNLTEEAKGSDPRLVDTDDDGLSDLVEDQIGSNPSNSLSPLKDRVLAVDGTPSSFVELADDTRFGLNTWTVESWIYARTIKDGSIAAREVQSGRYNWSLALTANGTLKAQFASSSLSTNVVLETPVCIGPNEWNHVAASFNGASGRFSISVNGIVLANTAVSAGYRPATGALGYHGARIGAGFDGYIEDVRIWGIFREGLGLNAFKTALTGAEAGLVGYYRFDDDTHAAGTSSMPGWLCRQVQDHTDDYAQDWLNLWVHAGSLMGSADIVPSPAESPLSAADVDSDADGLPDGWESANGLNPFSGAGLHGGQADADGDGLSNYGEYLSGTHPWLKDTDADGVNDAFDDADADGLTNLAEVRDYNTLPTLADTDDDGFSDFQEVTGLVASNPRGKSSPINSMDPIRRQSLCFTGNGRVEIPDQVRHNLAAWTIHAWVNPLPGSEGIVIRRQVFTQSQLNKLNGINYELGVYNDAGTPRAYVQYAGLTAAAPASITPVRVDCRQPQEIPGDGFTRAIVRPNVWTHLAAVYDPSINTLRLYVNGELVSYRSDAFPPFGLGTQGELVVRGLTTIGGGSLSSPGVAADGFEGCIDEAVILPRAVETDGVRTFAHTVSVEQSSLLSGGVPYIPVNGGQQPIAQLLGRQHLPNQVIVRFKDGLNAADQNALVEQWGMTTKRSLIQQPIRCLNLPAGMTVEAALQLLSNHGAVQYSQPNYTAQFSRTPSDARFGELWGMRNVGQTIQGGAGGIAGADAKAVTAWDATVGSRDIIVAVNDSGVDISHPDLAANIWTNPGEIAGNGIDDDGNGYIDDIHGWDFVNNDAITEDNVGHGTHVAGTIGAVGDNNIGVAGVNWKVTIMPCKAGDFFLTTDSIAAALEYAVMNGAHVSNHSYGGYGTDQVMLDAFRFASLHDHLVVCAAGNEANNNDVTPALPASFDFPNMISVAALDRNDLLADFSNYGAATVDLGAPGVEILSTTPGATYQFFDGTSMASPHVAGAAALILSKAPNLKPSAVKQILMSTSRPVAALQGVTVSGGALNLAAAVTAGSVVAPVAYLPFDDGGLSAEDFTIQKGWTNNWKYAGVLLNASWSTNTYLGTWVDGDGDEMPDWWEVANGLDPNSALGNDGAEADIDADGISNLTEYLAGTHPWTRDSDQDGILDGLEDNDQDGITAIDEQNFTQTHPGLRDTDDDGLDDKFEVVTGTFPDDSLSPAFPRFVKLDGTAGTYVEYPNQPRFNLTSWTIDMMIKVSALPSTNAVLFARNLLRKNDLTNFNYNLSLTPAGKVVGGFTGTTGTDVAIQSATAIPLGVWTWVSLAFNDETGRLSVLIDGRVSKAITTPERPMTSIWGEAYILAGSGFNGCIDEIRVWNNDHSTIVQAMPLDRPQGTEPNLVAWSLFDDATAMGGVSGKSTIIKGQVEDFVYRADWIKGWQHAATLVGNAQILKSGTSFGLGADCAIDSFLDLGAYPWQTGAYNNRRGTVLTDPRKYHFCQSTVVYSGKTAVQAGGINTSVNPSKFALGDNETSWLRTSVVGPGRICFQWKCEIEPPAFVGNEADYYTFFVDGVQRALITGSVDWTNQCAEIAAGVHSLSWQFSKDRFGAWPTNLNAAIKDSVFLDAVNFVHTGPDTDGDGLPDAYETLSTLPAPLGRTNPNLADTDGDGINDGDEISLGLNPLVSNMPVINSMSMVNGRLTINWTGTAGLRYLVQKSYNLTTWVNAPNGFLPNEISQVVAPVTGPLQYRDPQSPEAGSPSYRVLVIP